MERQVRVNHAEGLHARPAADFVKAASSFKSRVDLVSGIREANAKSILGLLKLGVKSGQVVILRVEGPDEEEAIQVLSGLLEQGA
ncbi:HPr family phosphocarrier protein [Ammoniphilus sp. 3BR4]|uniref:HPr family phosphocarrier protein n=1 Tax=Ammoniphilus sp. 3BR4 TaxID=3158265 RepID=UPI0034668A65